MIPRITGITWEVKNYDKFAWKNRKLKWIKFWKFACACSLRKAVPSSSNDPSAYIMAWKSTKLKDLFKHFSKTVESASIVVYQSRCSDLSKLLQGIHFDMKYQCSQAIKLCLLYHNIDEKVSTMQKRSEWYNKRFCIFQYIYKTRNWVMELK